MPCSCCVTRKWMDALCAPGVEGKPGDFGGPTDSSDPHTPAPPRMRAHQLSTGSTPATKGQFPFIVSIQMALFHKGGGTILTPHTILTAAHVLEYPAEHYEVAAGEHNLKIEEGSEQRREVARCEKHANYKPNTTVGFSPNDIALLLLKEPLKFNEFVKPATLPPPKSDTSGNVVLAGWGFTDDALGTKPEVLMTQDLPVLSHAQCMEEVKKMNDQVDEDMLPPNSIFCTGPLTDEMGPCKTDSGSPLLQDGMLVGIVSWKFKNCGEPHNPAGHTRVSAFIQWIGHNDHLLRFHHELR